MTRPTASCVALLILLALCGPRAAAQPDAPGPGGTTERARELFKRAEVHFSLGAFKRALPLYAEAYRLQPLPEFLFNMGQCHRHLGEHARAVFHYRQFLLKKPDSDQRAQVEQLIREGEDRIKAAGELAAARHTLELRQAAPHCEPCRVPRAWFWAGLGVTAALAATAIVTGVLAGEANDEYSDPATSLARRQQLLDDGRALEVTSWTTMSVAVVTAGGSALLYWFSRPRAPVAAGLRAPAAARLHLSPVVAAEGGGVALWGLF